jgi:uncharacterized protein
MRTLFIENREEIFKIIRSCKTCYIAMSENDVPYVLPMNFGLTEDSVILHSAQSGRMWETLKKNRNVCINWTLGEELAWQNVRVGCSFRVISKSVLVEGKAEITEDFDEKTRLLKILMSQYSDLEFKFNRPAVENVGIIKVKIEKITAKEFGAKTVPNK